MNPFARKAKAVPDQKALARSGETARRRLDADPNIHRLPTEEAEIYAAGGFLDKAECWQLTTLIDRVAQPSTLFASSDADPGYRTSYSGHLDPNNPYVQMADRRIADLLGIDPECGETLQGQRYMPGQQYKEHYDWFPTGMDYWKTERKRGGQRCWTAMIFLNDVEEGGETHFTRAGLKVTPEMGALLVWNNATPEGMPNEQTMHAALPVIKGVKHVVTKWFRVRKWA